MIPIDKIRDICKKIMFWSCMGSSHICVQFCPENNSGQSDLIALECAKVLCHLLGNEASALKMYGTVCCRLVLVQEALWGTRSAHKVARSLCTPHLAI